VILTLGTNDFQFKHHHTAQHAAASIKQLINTIREAPIEPDMPIPKILVIAPPPIQIAKG
jgi:lysophospholipase L1-like esterase